MLRPMVLGAAPRRPLVSVLLANYNYARYLPESIESVLSQTYAHWELIICDDGSTDDSVAVAERYAERDDRIRVLRKPNGGHASTLNAAYEVSGGDLIALLDSDDLYLPTKLEQAVAASFTRPEAGLLCHRVIRVDGARRREGVWPLSDLPEGWFGPELLADGGILPYLPPTSGLLLRREAAERLFPLSTVPPLHMCPDQTLMRLAPLLTSVAAIPEALAEYRIHGSNTYVQRRVTAQSLTKEVALTRALWQEQRRFLAAQSPSLAEQLTNLDGNVHVAFSEYVAARLAGGAANRREPYERYVRAAQRQGRPKWFALWRSSIYFPLPVFRLFTRLVLCPNPLKQLAARLRGLS